MVALDVIAPGIGPSRFKVVRVALVGIGLALKRDVAVSISAHGQSREPFHQIGQIKEHEQHLALLHRVYALMVHQLMAQINPWVYKKHPQKVDGRETAKRQYVRADNFHGDKVTIFFVYRSPFEFHFRAI